MNPVWAGLAGGPRQGCTVTASDLATKGPRGLEAAADHPSGRKSEEGVAVAESYVEAEAKKFAATGATAEEKKRRYELRRRSLLAKQSQFVADLRNLAAVHAVK